MSSQLVPNSISHRIAPHQWHSANQFLLRSHKAHPLSTSWGGHVYRSREKIQNFQIGVASKVCSLFIVDLKLLSRHGFGGDLRSRLRYAEGMIERLMQKSSAGGGMSSMTSSTNGQTEKTQSLGSLKLRPQSAQV